VKLVEDKDQPKTVQIEKKGLSLTVALLLEMKEPIHGTRKGGFW
jgi:hypothetical protein